MIEDLRATISKIEDHISDAERCFKQAFSNGYENMETNMDKGFEHLNKATNLM